MSSACTVLILLLHATIVAGGREMSFEKFPDKVMVAVTPVHTFSISRPLTCHAQCLRRQDCVALAVSGSSCDLYDTTVTEPDSQLQSEQGTAVFSQGQQGFFLIALLLPYYRQC